jgi:hypothetical protein
MAGPDYDIRILLDFYAYYFSFFTVILSAVFITLQDLSKCVVYDIQKNFEVVSSTALWKTIY